MTRNEESLLKLEIFSVLQLLPIVNITLKPEQVEIIQQKLQSGRYKTFEDLLAQTFQLLNDWDEYSLTEDTDWIESTRKKVDEAIASLEANGGSDGETMINQMLDKFRQARESQQYSTFGLDGTP